jgi:hypothetical protein
MQYYDGREHRYVDIPITDVMQVVLLENVIATSLCHSAPIFYDTV